MKNVKIEKAKVLEIVKANRDKHRAIFLEALDGWKAAVLKEVERLFNEAKADRINKSVFVNLPRPTDHTRDYDRAIQMLDLEVESVVTLSNEDFANLVQDDWDWRNQFLASNSAYSGTARRLAAE